MNSAESLFGAVAQEKVTFEPDNATKVFGPRMMVGTIEELIPKEKNMPQNFSIHRRVNDRLTFVASDYGIRQIVYKGKC